MKRFFATLVVLGAMAGLAASPASAAPSDPTQARHTEHAAAQSGTPSAQPLGWDWVD